jgi:hypothetical protein
MPEDLRSLTQEALDAVEHDLRERANRTAQERRILDYQRQLSIDEQAIQRGGEGTPRFKVDKPFGAQSLKGHAAQRLHTTGRYPLPYLPILVCER